MGERVIKAIAYVALAIYVVVGTFIGCRTAEMLRELEELLRK
jgi:hypothetical protein